jgi:hypothetical protein
MPHSTVWHFVKSFFPGWGGYPSKIFGFFGGFLMDLDLDWFFSVTGYWPSMDMDNWYSKSIVQITLLQSKVTGQG